jgi:nitroreductase
MLATSGMAILACGDIEVAFESNIGYLVQDVSAAIQNLLLAAHGLGLGACWVGVYPSEPSIRKMAELFRLPGSIVPIAAISIGVPGESPEARTRFNPASVRSEKW